MLRIFMNKTLLSYFTYDLFWGLQFNPQKISINNLGKAAEALLHNPTELFAIQNFQQEIYSKNILIRAFYWIFNIGNYRLNFYKLAAFESYSGYRDKIGSNVEENQHKPLYEFTDTLKSSTYHEIHDMFFNFVTSNKIVNQSEQEYQGVRKDGSVSVEQNMLVLKHGKDQHSSERNEESFTVCIYSKNYLKFLGMEAQEGETISWKKIQTAYRKMALKTHTDKGNDVEDFHLLSEVLEHLKTISSMSVERRCLLDDWDLQIKLLNYSFKKFEQKYEAIEKIVSERLEEMVSRIVEKIINKLEKFQGEFSENYNGENTTVLQEEIREDAASKLDSENNKIGFVLSDEIHNLSIPKSLICTESKLEIIKYPDRSYVNNFRLFSITNATLSSENELEVETKNIKKVNH